jgi:hypothetical protein
LGGSVIEAGFAAIFVLCFAMAGFLFLGQK